MIKIRPKCPSLVNTMKGGANEQRDDLRIFDFRGKNQIDSKTKLGGILNAKFCNKRKM